MEGGGWVQQPAKSLRDSKCANNAGPNFSPAMPERNLHCWRPPGCHGPHPAISRGPSRRSTCFLAAPEALHQRQLPREILPTACARTHICSPQHLLLVLTEGVVSAGGHGQHGQAPPILQLQHIAAQCRHLEMREGEAGGQKRMESGVHVAILLSVLQWCWLQTSSNSSAVPP